MNQLTYISLLSLLMLSGCNFDSKTPAVHATVLAPASPPTSKDSILIKDNIDHIVFGRFCGECSGRCAIMFRYQVKGDTTSLFMDSTDSYFTKRGQVTCNTIINDHRKLSLAADIYNHIPPQLLTEVTRRFGCPDCTDGCGIYVEIGAGSIVKQFAIDYQTAQLSGYIKDFAVYLKNELAQMKE